MVSGLANLGQSNFGQSIFGLSIFVLLCVVVVCCVVLCCCVVVCCLLLFGVVWCGPPSPGPLLPGPPSPEPPKISRFFSLSRHNFHSFFPLLGVFSWNFGGVLKHQDPEKCTFGLSGCRVRPRRLWDFGVTTFSGFGPPRP